MLKMTAIYLAVLLFTLVKAIPTNKSDSRLINHAENPVVKKFQQYLQIDTSRPENIYQAVEFWKRQAQAVGLSFKVYEPAGKPICVITWEGANSSLPSIMLNSHMDVVPVEPEDWTYPPFSGYMDESGDIFGRGAQDTKDVSIQYLEAISALRQNNVTLQRTLHITLMPDEETGGFHGIKPWINSQEFKQMNVGFVLDEGLASADDTILATYVDKRPWQMEFILRGKGGHGSTIPDGSAMEKVTKLVDTVMAFRDEQKKILQSHDAQDFGSYTTLNVNILQGGIATNIIPTHMKVVVDMRLATNANATEMEEMVTSWIKEAGGNSSLKFIRRDDVSVATPVDVSNPYWVALLEAARDMNITMKPTICPATSDMLVLRGYGIPAIGFAPKTRTVSRIHGANEYLNADTLLRGIGIYFKILNKLGNLP